MKGLGYSTRSKDEMRHCHMRPVRWLPTVRSSPMSGLSRTLTPQARSPQDCLSQT